jgi:hypothetical protein
LSKGLGWPNNFAKVFLKKADIDGKRVSGDTLSHLLLLTLEPGAAFMRLPQFFCAQIHVAKLISRLLPF